jgi:putative peptidoglycan lipid II flippase
MATSRVFSILHREIRGLQEAAYLLAFFTLGSQVVALLRDRLLAHTFGVGETLDLFYAAFRIPDTMYALLASMVSLFVLIPFLEAAEKQGQASVREFLSDMFSFFSGILLVVAATAWIFAPWIVSVLYGSFSPPAQAELVSLSRILLIQPLLLGVSNLFAAYVQIKGRFLLYAIAPVLYNVGIIIGILVLYPVMGQVGLAWGVVLGALFHLSVQTPFMIKHHTLPRLVWPAWGRVFRVVRISVPRTMTLSAQQFSMLALVSMASLYATGSIASFSLAWNLQAVPLALIGVSFSVAAFPKLSRLFGNGDRVEYERMILLAAQQIIFWALPATALVIVLRAQIVRVILGSGAFDWTATMLTGAVLALLSVSLVAQSLVVLLVRACYAAGRTWIPLVLNVGSSLVTVGVATVLLRGAAFGYLDLAAFSTVMRVTATGGTQVLLIALAYSVGALFNLVLLLAYFENQYPTFLKRLGRTSFQALVASLVAACGAYLALDVLDDIVSLRTGIGVFLQGAGAGFVGAVLWVLTLITLGSKDIEAAWAAFHKQFTRTRVEEARGSIETL